MKTLLLNIQTTTSTFNLFGKIITYTILIGILIAAMALIVGVVTTNNIQFRY